MKKLIILTFMALPVLTACQGALEREKKTQTEAENKAIVNSLRTVEYNGHSYIIYREIFGTKNFGGITHDPECGCEETNYFGGESVKFYGCEGDCIIQ